MLIHLQIRDLAVVEQLDLDFGAGLSVITGETGAGKSIMVDALGLLLGDRSDNSVIRHGAERAEISASFDLTGLPAAQAWLQAQQLDAAGECHLRRVLTPGRSRCYVNGSSQPLTALRELGAHLVDIHGQHEHQSLLRRDVQSQLLDAYAGQQSLAAEVAELFQQWQRRRRELTELDKADADRDARRDLLRFQVGELDALAPEADEPETLAAEQRRLTHAERLVDGSRQLLQSLYDDDEQSIYGELSRLETALASLAELDDRLQSALELLANGRIALDEASQALRHYGGDLEPDTDRLQQIEHRLDSYYSLARKHRCEPNELTDVLPQLRQALDQLEHYEQHRVQLAASVDQAHQDWRARASALSEQRRQAAAALSERVSSAMQGLGMPGGQLQVQLQPLAEPSARGLESAAFMVSANPGQPLGEIARIASGGELSRISLAIQVVSAGSSQTPTLIFDEVDTGIGGAVAEVVGRQLRRLGRSHQVLCVTHLPQVAVQANWHYRVSKSSRTGRPRTRVESLAEKPRVEEIARMLGGVKLTDQTRAHAQEMLAQAAAE